MSQLQNKKRHQRKFRWSTRTLLLLVTIASVLFAINRPSGQLLQTVTTPLGDEFKVCSFQPNSSYTIYKPSEPMCYLYVFGPEKISQVNCFPTAPDECGLGTVCAIYVIPEARAKHLKFEFKTSYDGKHHVLVEQDYPATAMMFYDEESGSINCGVSRGLCAAVCGCNRIAGKDFQMIHRAWDAAFGNHLQRFRILTCETTWHGND